LIANAGKTMQGILDEQEHKRTMVLRQIANSLAAGEAEA